MPPPRTTRRPRQARVYAGAYVYGRRGPSTSPRTGRRNGGRPRLAMTEWKVLLRDRVPAYVSWDQFLANRARLQANDPRGDRGGPPRSGAGLLTGLVRCGSCGWRLQTSHSEKGHPYYY